MLVAKGSTVPTDMSSIPKVSSKSKKKRQRRRGKKQRAATIGESNPARLDSKPQGNTDPGPIEAEWKSREKRVNMDALVNNNTDFGYNPDPADNLGSAPEIMKHGYQGLNKELWLGVQMGGKPYRVTFEEAKEDMPRKLAFYIQRMRIGTRGLPKKGPYHRWAQEFLIASERVNRRLQLFHKGYTTGDNGKGEPRNSMGDLPYVVKAGHCAGVRRIAKRSCRSNKSRKSTQVKFGVEVPRDADHAYELDVKNGNTLWTDAIKLEIDTLMSMGTLVFCKTKSEDAKLSKDIAESKEYQYAIMWLIFDVKPDGRRKARLVIGGHMTSPSEDIECYSSMMKQESSRLLMLVAHSRGYDVAVGDVVNAYLNALTKEKIWTRGGTAFVRTGYAKDKNARARVVKAQYGLKSSGHQFWALLSDTLHSLGFFRCGGDPDIWMRTRGEDAYDYIGTHVDDLMVVSRDAQGIFKELEVAYTFKSTDRPKYHLGVDYHFVEDKRSRGTYHVGSGTYINEALTKVEGLIGEKLRNCKAPMPTGWHPELDDSPPLDGKEHTLYMQLIGIGLWINSIGRMDVSFSISSLSRYSAAPRFNHLKELIGVFGYLRFKPDRRIAIDSNTPEIKGDTVGDRRDLSMYYQGSEEDIGSHPVSVGEPINTSIWFDADHAHDKVTFKSISGLIIFVGKTPVKWTSTRQGAIKSSTYGAEFMAGRSAVEEAKAI